MRTRLRLCEGVHERQETRGIEEAHDRCQNIRTASWIAVYWERDQERKGSIPALPSDLRFYCCRRQSPIPESSQPAGIGDRSGRERAARTRREDQE